jgi:hypothetical protein
MSETKEAMRWLQTRDSGISSEAIMQTMLGAPASPGTYPSDAEDLGRCIRLLDRIPAWRERLPEMAQVGYVWASLVEHWCELETLYRGELNEQPKRRPCLTYLRMRELITAGLEADHAVTIHSRSPDGTPSHYETRWAAAPQPPRVSQTEIIEWPTQTSSGPAPQPKTHSIRSQRTN